MDWKSVEERIVQDDQSKWDRKAGSQQLAISQQSKLEVSNGNGVRDCYALSDLATSQICQRLSIPVEYYRRLPGEMKSVVAKYDLERLNERSYLLRGKGDWLRAFLSAEYVAYNNSQIAETVQGLLNGAAVSVEDLCS